MPERTRPTSERTGAWRWEVPMTPSPSALNISIWAGRTLEGPEPNRPSRGRRAGGITRWLASAGIGPVSQVTGQACQVTDRCIDGQYLAGRQYSGPDETAQGPGMDLDTARKGLPA